MRLLTSTFVLLSFAAMLTADSFGPAFTGYTITPVFRSNIDSPQVQFIPLSFGGISQRPDNLNQLVVGGYAEGSAAAFYSVGVTRDLNGHIFALNGSKSLFASAPRLASGAAFGPSFHKGEVFFYTIASGSGGVDVGMIRWGTTMTTRTANVVPETPGSLNFVPPGFGGFQKLKVLTNSGKFYSVAYESNADGTYNLVTPLLKATLPVANAQAFVYVKAGSPGFTTDSLLVAEYAAGTIAAYEVDSDGNPLPGTRQVFFSGPPFSRPEGMVIDQQTGDLLITTFSSSTSGIYRISGFIQPAEIPVTGCQSITSPGFYRVDDNLSGVAPCIQIRNTSNVHLNCSFQSLYSFIWIDNVDHFSIRNCRLQSLPEESPSLVLLRVTNSRNGLIGGNRLGTPPPTGEFTIGYGGPSHVKLDHSDSVNIVDNDIFGFVSLEHSSHNSIRNNRVTYQPPRMDGEVMISSSMGSWNTFDRNVVDARAPFGGRRVSSATYALLETHDVFSYNSLMCRSTTCLVLSSTSQSFVNANTASGGSWTFQGSDTTDVTWSNNQQQGLVFDYEFGTYYSNGFTVHRALRNKFIRNSTPSWSTIHSVDSPAGQNLIQENYFGHRTSAYPGLSGNPDLGTAPAGAFIDGGGNICLPAPGAYPLVCH